MYLTTDINMQNAEYYNFPGQWYRFSGQHIPRFADI